MTVLRLCVQDFNGRFLERGTAKGTFTVSAVIHLSVPYFLPLYTPYFVSEPYDYGTTHLIPHPSTLNLNYYN